MDEAKIQKLEKSISNLKDKSDRIYLFAQDTKGNAKASIRYIYQIALTLKNSGYNTIILHEKSDYQGVSEWLGSEYMELPHKAIDNQNLEISPEDFILIPEIFGFIMEQIKDLPCAKIVLCQAYDHMMETLQPGFGWANYGFLKCITTSEYQKEYISSVMKNISIDILEPVISDAFKKTSTTQQPIVGVHSRDPRKTLILIKTFYLKYPQYRWVTFRDLRGLTELEFANYLQSCCASVWIDETSGFGTFPLESMKCGVPCIGKVPALFPEWMNEDNGIWISEKNAIVDVASDFIQNWLEDNLNIEMFSNMEKTSEKYSNVSEFEKTVCDLFSDHQVKRAEIFENQLKKLQNN
jgi:hypothetical protein